MTVGRLELELDIQPKFVPGGGWFSNHPDTVTSTTDQLPWLLASGAKGLEQFQVPLLGPEDKPAQYRVRMIFADTNPNQVDALHVKLQGAERKGETQYWPAADGKSTSALVREYDQIPVISNLVVDFQPEIGPPQAKLAAVEIVRLD
jgi:hypothetical protein